MQSGNMTGDDRIQFTKEEREVFRKPRTLRLVFDLSLPWLQAIIGCTIFVAHPALWTWLIAIILIAGAQHGLSLISHEAAHRLIWPQSRKINDAIATYLFAAPLLLPFEVYRQRHLIHHRLVSLPGDTKSFYLRDMRGWKFGFEILKSLTGVDYFLQAVGAIRAGKEEGYEEFASNLRRDQRSILLVHGVLFLVFTYFDPMLYGFPTYYFILWLWPMVTISFLLGKLRSLVEHQPARTVKWPAQETSYFMGTPGPMLRSVKATWLERLFLSKIHFHYHAEHHLWPWISYQYLPTVHKRIWQGSGKKLRCINGCVVTFDPSYTVVLRNVIRGN